MKKSKINLLFAISLMLALVFSFSAVSINAYAAGKKGGVAAENRFQGQGVRNGSSTDEEASSSDSNVGKQKEERDQEEINAEEHRSAVSKFVQNLLSVADREGGIGEQVRTIAREQNQSASTTIQAMERVQSRNKIRTFFLGSDYKNLGTLRSEMVQTNNRLEQLNRLLGSAQGETDKIDLQNQIQALQQEQQKISNFVKTNENQFSLFGWFVKLFNK